MKKSQGRPIPASRLYLLWILGAFIGGIAALCGGFYVTQPEIRLDPALLSDPRVFHFTLRNSAFLPMRAVQIDCILNKATIDDRRSVEGLDIHQEDPDYSVSRGAAKRYSCPFEQLFTFPGQVLSADLVVRIHFKTLRLPRKATSDHFVWTIVTRKWSKLREGD